MTQNLTQDQIEAQALAAMIKAGRRDLTSPEFARDLDYAVKEALRRQAHGLPAEAAQDAEADAEAQQREAEKQRAEAEALRQLIQAGRTDFESRDFLRTLDKTVIKTKRQKASPPVVRPASAEADAEPAPAPIYRPIRRKVNGQTLYALGGALRQGNLF